LKALPIAFHMRKLPAGVTLNSNHVRVRMIKEHIISEAREFSASPRWASPDTPGSARVKELHYRLVSPEKYADFRATHEGEFLLSVLETYEGALNDDWLPFEILGLSLNDAQLFIGLVAQEIESNDLSVAISNLKESYEQFTKL
jgi:hypothetical protein